MMTDVRAAHSNSLPARRVLMGHRPGSHVRGIYAGNAP